MSRKRKIVRAGHIQGYPSAGLLKLALIRLEMDLDRVLCEGIIGEYQGISLQSTLLLALS